MSSLSLKPTLSELGARIKELSEELERLLKENDVEAPTLAADSPANISKFTPDIFTTKQLLQDTMNDLSIISQGPSESVFNYAHNVRLLHLLSLCTHSLNQIPIPRLQDERPTDSYKGASRRCSS